MSFIPSSGQSATFTVPTTPVPTPGPTPTPVSTSIAAPIYSTVTGPDGKVVIQPFSLRNWLGAPSTGMHRLGRWFGMGVVPAGSSLKLMRGATQVAVQWDSRVTYPDGSLFYAVAHLRDADFAAGERRIYLPVVQAGAFDNASAGTLADITGPRDIKVRFANTQQTSDGTTFTPVGSGALTASLRAHAAVATRIDRLHSGPVCDTWRVWGMATDDAGGAADAHLKANWYLTRWKASDGSTLSVEAAAVPAQDWWSIPNKQLRRYDAALVDGTTVIEAYTGVVHPYNQQWITCQKRGNNAGRRHWIGAACPTLELGWSKAEMSATGAAPPLNVARVPNANPIPAYVPCGAINQRANIDGTGAYDGRGVWPNTATAAFMRQTAADMATARLNGHAGLHVYYHYRSNNLRTRPGEAADIANTPISLRLDAPGRVPAVPSFDFTGDGMPAPVHAYYDYRASQGDKDGRTDPTGGDGVWGNQTHDASHSVNYCGFIYALEGEPYHLEAMLDLASNVVQMTIGNAFYGRQYLPFGNPVSDGAMYVVPDPHSPPVLYDGIGVTGQIRNTAWVSIIIGAAAGYVPDAHPAARATKRLNAQQGIYLSDVLDVLPPNARQSGIAPWKDTDATIPPWQVMLSSIGCYYNARLTRDPGMRAWADYCAQMVTGAITSGPYATLLYGGAAKPNPGSWNATSNPFFPAGDLRAVSYASIDHNTGIATLSNLDYGFPLTDGDTLYARTDAGPLPAELQTTVPYYVLKLSDTTCRLSRSPGGSAISFAADVANVAVAPKLQAQGANPPPLGAGHADNYGSMGVAASVSALLAGNPAMTAALVQKQAAFMSLADSSGWVNWDYAVPGAAEAVAPAVAPIPLVPGQVTGVTATSPSKDALLVSASAPATGGAVTGYLVEYRLASSSGAYTATTATVSGNLVDFAINGLTGQTSYSVRVTAQNAGGLGTPSSTISAITATPSPTGYTVTIREQSPAVPPNSQNLGRISVVVTKDSDGTSPASVLMGVSSTGADTPSDPNHINGGYDNLGYSVANQINYGGVFYELSIQLGGGASWTYVIKTPDGVARKIPGAVVTVVS